jgi:hypothetical protein
LALRTVFIGRGGGYELFRDTDVDVHIPCSAIKVILVSSVCRIPSTAWVVISRFYFRRNFLLCISDQISSQALLKVFWNLKFCPSVHSYAYFVSGPAQVKLLNTCSNKLVHVCVLHWTSSFQNCYASHIHLQLCIKTRKNGTFIKTLAEPLTYLQKRYF